MNILEKINKTALMWNKTKDPQYKELWYKLIKEFSDGINNTKRRDVSTHCRNKRNNERYRISKSSWYNLL
jgi:hypothetical protein